MYIYVYATFKQNALTPITYQNQREENSILRLFQFELIGKWTSENQSRTKYLLQGTHPAGRAPFLEIFGPCCSAYKLDIATELTG